MKLIQTKEYLLFISEKREPFNVGNYGLNRFDKRVTLCNEENRLSIEEHWRKIYAYFPLTNYSKELDLPLLPNPFEEEVNIEKLAEKAFPLPIKIHNRGAQYHTHLGRNPYKGLKKWIKAYTAGYKAAQSKQEELLLKAFRAGRKYEDVYGFAEDEVKFLNKEEDLIQSLSTQQLPKEFIIAGVGERVVIGHNGFQNEFGNIIYKTVINSEGKQVIQGTYKY